MTTFRLLVADDHTLLRQDLITLLGLRDGVAVVGTPATGEAACTLVDHYQPDVALINTSRLDHVDGWLCMRALKDHHPRTVVIVLTSRPADGGALGALRNGADGFLLQNHVTDRLILALTDTKLHEVFPPPGSAAHVAARLLEESLTAWHAHREVAHGEFTQFSRREQEIIDLLLQGMSNRQIAQRLFMTEGTIKNYMSAIYAKVGVHNRASAVVCLQKCRRMEAIEEMGANSAE